MTEPGPQAPSIPAPSPPPSHPALQAPQQPELPVQQPELLAQQPQQAQQPIININWSHLKPEEDAEAHLLLTNNWMNADHFLEGIKVKILSNTSRRG